MMTALGDPTRQAIFDRLSDGPRPVGELAAELPVSRPAVTQHLQVLNDVGLTAQEIARQVVESVAGLSMVDQPQRVTD